MKYERKLVDEGCTITLQDNYDAGEEVTDNDPHYLGIDDGYDYASVSMTDEEMTALSDAILARLGRKAYDPDAPRDL